MNNVVQYASNGFGGTRTSSVLDAIAVLVMETIQMMITTTTMMKINTMMMITTTTMMKINMMMMRKTICLA
jgi:hypothetical protein